MNDTIYNSSPSINEDFSYSATTLYSVPIKTTLYTVLHVEVSLESFFNPFLPYGNLTQKMIREAMARYLATLPTSLTHWVF